MRGLYQGRFRDHDALVLQAELRFPLFWRLGAVAFAGAGEVFRGAGDFALDALTWTGGGGTVDRDARVIVRLEAF